MVKILVAMASEPGFCGCRAGLLTVDVGRIDFQFTFDDQGTIIGEEVVFVAGQQEGQFEHLLCSVLAA